MMSGQGDPQAALRERANGILSRLAPSEREALLIKCWMSHDARWFMAVAGEFGMEAANRLNQVAAHEVGKAETRRIARALELPAAKTIDDWLLAQEVFLVLLGPDLVDYRVTKVDSSAFEVDVRRCFARDNAVRAGIIERYQCGIFARITGWLEAQGLGYEISPPLGRCLKAQGEQCLYRFTLRFDGEDGRQDGGGVERRAAGRSR